MGRGERSTIANRGSHFKWRRGRMERAEEGEAREDFEAVIGPRSGGQDRINTQAAYLIVMLVNMDMSAQDRAMSTVDSLLGRLELEAKIHQQAVRERIARSHAHAKPGLSVPLSALGDRSGEGLVVGNARRTRLEDSL